jgi:Tfp pilus assembly protein PilO
MLKLIGINVDKWVEYAIIALVAVGLVVGGYFYWKHGVTETAQISFNNEQLKQTLKDKEEYINQLEAIDKARQQAIVDLNKQKDDLSAQLKDLDDYLNSADAAKDDRESSAVLKKTIQKLRKL